MKKPSVRFAKGTTTDMLELVEVKTSRELSEFIALPYRLYRDDPNFVPPLRSQMKSMLFGGGNPLFDRGPHSLWLCRDGKKAVGRIMVGIDERYNEENGSASAWISLFECIHDEDAAAMLLGAAEDWASRRGMSFLRGPDSPDQGDSYRGLLVMGFDGPPALMNSYNPAWYGGFFEKYGYVKSLDLYAYALETDKVVTERSSRVIQAAMKRFGYHVDYLDMANLDRDLHDLHDILARTIPAWPGERMAVPEFSDVQKLAASMLPIAEPDLICIARTDDGGEPVGFVVALPEYNQVFRHIRNGRLFPFGFMKFAYYRKKITAVRVFMQFVVPEWQGRAVNNAIFYRMCETARRKGYLTGDGSSIGETNMPSRLSVEKLGGVHYRTYRMYKKDLLPSSP